MDETAISALRDATTTTDGDSVMIPQDLLIADLLVRFFSSFMPYNQYVSVSNS